MDGGRTPPTAYRPTPLWTGAGATCMAGMFAHLAPRGRGLRASLPGGRRSVIYLQYLRVMYGAGQA